MKGLRDDYKDPGPYKFPKGPVAYEIDVPQSEPPRQTGEKGKTTKEKAPKPTDMKGMKGM